MVATHEPAHEVASNGDNRGLNDSVCRYITRGGVNQYTYIAFFLFISLMLRTDLQPLSAAHSPWTRVQQCHCWSGTGPSKFFFPSP